jgi:transposase
MPTKRKAMRQIKEVLRLKFEAKLSHERIATATGLSKGAVTSYLKRAADAGIGWPLVPPLDDVALEARLFRAPGAPAAGHVAPDFARIHQELKRKGVTLQLLWEEYSTAHPGFAYRYSQFCLHYARFRNGLKRSMRQMHRAGEKLFLDYSGATVPIIDAGTGELRSAQIFVAVLGASNYTYAEASWSQSLPDWIGSHLRTFEFMGAVPALLVPDNLKSAIKRACRYEPEATSTYGDMARHYGTAILPARPFHPRDKAAVEAGVLLVQRWILARLRHRQFFTLAELNAAIRALLIELNQRPFKKLPGSRASVFAEIDLPAMAPLPTTRYEFAEWKAAIVNIDYHVEIDGHYYSVPHSLVRLKLEVSYSATTVECFFKGKRVAAHARSHSRGRHTTLAEHMPESHRKHSEWSPGRLLNWALSIGPGTRNVVKWQFDNRPHPEQGYRACLGLLNLAKRYGPARLEAACRRALAIGSPTRKRIKSILDTKLDQQPELFATPAPETPVSPPAPHANVRGADFFRSIITNDLTHTGDAEPCSSNPPSIH